MSSLIPAFYCIGKYERCTTPERKELGEAIPFGYDLMQNYLNPFNPTTLIQYDLPQAGQVRLVVYNLLGRQIRTLVDRQQRAGHFQTIWDATDERNLPVAAGIYFCRLVLRQAQEPIADAGEEFVKVIKLTLVK